MSDRVSVTLTTGSASPANPGPRVARYFIAGQTQMGPATGPVVVRSMTEYVATFGARTGGTAMYDAAELFFDRAQAGEMVVMRATGPSAVKATITLDSKVTVAARNPGSYYNAWTATYTNSTKTITIVKGSTTVTYTGATAADLQAAAAVDPDVTVTVSSLPAGDFGPTALATGNDDYGNVVWATTLALIPDSYGPGAIATPGVAFGTSGSALAGHAKTNRRLALVSAAAGTSAATAATNAATVAAYTGAENTVFVWPHVKVSDGANGLKTIDGVSFAAAARAIAQRQFGVGVSPIQRQVGSRITGVTPELTTSSAEFTSLRTAKVSMIRVVNDATQLDNWVTTAAPSNNSNLLDAQFRDVTNAVADGAAVVLERHVGKPASSSLFYQVASELSGVCDGFRPYLLPAFDASGREVHPGYKVVVNAGASPADNRITANIALRFSEYADFIDLTVASYDAGANI